MNTAIARAENVILPSGGTISTTAGSVARLLLATINVEIENAYEKLEEVHLQAYLSTANGEFLDLFGEMLNLERGNLTDDEYRYALSKQVTTLECCNELSVRMSLLAVDGVQDITLIPFTHGTGSYTALIITENAVPSESVIAECRKVLEKVTAYGNRFEVTGPDLVPVEVGIKLVVKNDNLVHNNLKETAKNAIKEYINSRKIGEEIVINELIERVMKSSESIYDIAFFNFKVDNKKVLISNQGCRKHERFIESAKPDSICVY